MGGCGGAIAPPPRGVLCFGGDAPRSVGDRVGGWEVGGSIDLIEIYRFPPSNIDLDLIWAADCAIRHAAAV